MVYISTQIFLLIAVAFTAFSKDNHVVNGNDNSDGKLQVFFADGFISIQAKEASLQEILDKIARITKIRIHGAIYSKQKITISVDHLTVEETVRRLAKNTMIIYQNKANCSIPKISEIIVLSDGIDINSLPDEVAKSSSTIDTTTEIDQQLIDLPAPPPLLPPPPPPPPSD